MKETTALETIPKDLFLDCFPFSGPTIFIPVWSVG